MFKVGDVVDIVYTGCEYTGGIAIEHIHNCMGGNPHIISGIRGDWYCIEGDYCNWRKELLHPAMPKIPDWEI